MSSPNNISKFIVLTEFCLLEYEFNRDLSETALSTPVVCTRNGVKQYFELSDSIGVTNNAVQFNSIPITSNRDRWYTTNDNESFFQRFDASVSIVNTSYRHDNIKLHIISGYNFEDIAGFLVQVRTNDVSLNLLDLSNFTYRKQTYDASIMYGKSPSDIIKFNPNAIYIANKFYDKYIEFKVPSISVLGDNTPATNLGTVLNVKQSSDVFINFSTINTISSTGEFLLNENITLQLPIRSAADSFNCFISEATEGDFIKFYATWDGNIIGQSIGDIESGRISLYTSNNPNDSYESFSDVYGHDAAKWVINHEIYVWEHINQTQLLSQKYTFTQDTNFSAPNYFRPVLKTADIDTSYSVQYICRLTNRMDGTQIIRKASFSSMDPQKYGLKFTRLYVENLIPYKVFNRIEAEKANTQTNSGVSQTKYVQVYYDTTHIGLTDNNTIYPQGTGPLFLKNNDSIYKFKIQKYNENTLETQNFDLSGAFNYALLFNKDDGNLIEILPTYSTNMNTMLGELEFKINSVDITNLIAQKNNEYSIIIKNPNGTSYAFYQGKYYAYANLALVMSNYNNLSSVASMQSTIGQLQSQLSTITNEYNNLLRER
jgi:hypothetical protein